MLQGDGHKRPRIEEQEDEYAIDDDELLETELINRLLHDEGMNDGLSLTPCIAKPNGPSLISAANTDMVTKTRERADQIMTDEEQEYAVVDIDEDTLNEFDLQATQLLAKSRSFEIPQNNFQVPAPNINTFRYQPQNTIPTFVNTTQTSQKKSYFSNFVSQKPDLKQQLEQLQLKMQSVVEKNKKLEEDLLIRNGEISIVRNKLYKTNDKNLELQNQLTQSETKQKQVEATASQRRDKELERLKTELQFKEQEVYALRNSRVVNPTTATVTTSIPIENRRDTTKTVKAHSTFPTRDEFGRHSVSIVTTKKPTKSVGVDTSDIEVQSPESGFFTPIDNVEKLFIHDHLASATLAADPTVSIQVVQYYQRTRAKILFLDEICDKTILDISAFMSLYTAQKNIPTIEFLLQVCETLATISTIFGKKLLKNQMVVTNLEKIGLLLDTGKIAKYFGQLLVTVGWHSKINVQQLLLAPETLQYLRMGDKLSNALLTAIELVLDGDLCQHGMLCDTLLEMLAKSIDESTTTKLLQILTQMTDLAIPVFNLDKLVHYFHTSGNPKMISILYNLFCKIDAPKLDVESFTMLMACLCRDGSVQATQLFEMFE